MRNWLRKVEFTCGQKKFSMDDFNIDFEVNFDIKEDPNEATINIYNLTNDTVNTHFYVGAPVILNAGYDGIAGTIHSGFVLTSKPTWEGVDKKIQVCSIDSSMSFLKQFVNKTYSEGIFASQIIQDLAFKANLSIGEIKLNNDVQYPFGRSVSGRIKDVLKDIVQNDCGTRIQIIDGSIIIRDVGSGNMTGFLLNKDTGLIGNPEPIQKQEVSEGTKEKVQADYKVKCLLNYNIRSMSAVRVESKVFSGDCVVLRGKHIGSATGEFVSEMEVKLL